MKRLCQSRKFDLKTCRGRREREEALPSSGFLTRELNTSNASPIVRDAHITVLEAVKWSDANCEALLIGRRESLVVSDWM